MHDPNLLHPHFGGTVLNLRSLAKHLARNVLSFILETLLFQSQKFDLKRLVKYVENNGILADFGGFLTIFEVILRGV